MKFSTMACLSEKKTYTFNLSCEIAILGDQLCEYWFFDYERNLRFSQFGKQFNETEKIYSYHSIAHSKEFLRLLMSYGK